MRPSLKLLETTRAARLQEVIPRMDPEEKTALLQEFHPDSRPEGMWEIRVGRNTGESVLLNFQLGTLADFSVSPDEGGSYECQTFA
jgi:hypothetical protein